MACVETQSGFSFRAEVSAVKTLSHPFSDAVSPTGSRCDRITKTPDKPSQCCGSPYFPLTGLRMVRPPHLAKDAELFRPLHLLHAVARFSSLLAPPVEKASTWIDHTPQFI